ncbi:hypothetical protein C3747_13g7 [Trypanosoma cruzi]|uniref:DDRGK domain-containing protein 1 n=2 Tax=Trypanosoma cruzi TaxID=5693 RepID=Q4D3Q0_TRYCC|nr:hypothetical protein, conserved [Trypanosoma cruzi]EAN87153.1 hypothetical protein, conserved [Trypanosoma cruzi]KAF8293357.1 putative DDRGK domain containing protein [Trypanosoma cruzi]PWV18354.1 hypothetical protein C3747_13g7 [Trypanosoma cruzi]RNC61765.1 hypothetical protein TcCL_ESM00616 [Trypanosoma cruzi]|eukprot:XP_809004.1 hypothetical protein [Trypanosoma cruzi strain CL Brener]
MSFPLIGAFLLLLLLLCFVGVFICRRQVVPTRVSSRGSTRTSLAHKGSEADTEDDGDGESMTARHGPPNPQEVAALLRRRQAQRAQGRGDGAPDDGAATPQPKLTRLQKKKQEKDREREERRQAQEAAESNRRTRQEAERQRQEDHQRDEEERLLAEEKALQELRDEKKRQDDEEYAKWIGAIGLEECGEIGDEERVRQEALLAFLTGRARELEARQENQTEQLLKSASPTATATDEESSRSILVLSSVAREYNVTVDLLVKLIEKLLNDGVIGGVFDDRGKFIFVVEAHYREIALFIQQRGRVSVKELVRECNRVILS